MNSNAAIIAVGSELLTPYRTDTNSLWLTERLNHLGFSVRLKSVVGDDRKELSELIRSLLDRFGVIVSTGGLGPTEDDLTRDSFAEALELQLQFVPEILQRIAARFANRRIPMSDNNRRQAMVLEGAELLPNDRGTAPGMYLERNETSIVLLPGPPHELKAMFSKWVQPKLKARAGAVRLARRTLITTGLPESTLDQLIAPIYAEYTDIETTILSAPTGISIHLTQSTSDEVSGAARLDELVDKLVGRLEAHVFTTSGEEIEEVVGKLLLARGATVAAAESCTGGIVAKRLTDIPGSSRYFLGGVVVYSNEAKTNVLGVTAGLIEKHGAVSAEVAESLSRTVRTKFGSTYGVGVTGIAGPEGGTPEKPVGLVYLGVADAGEAVVRHLLLPGDRAHVRAWSAQIALDMLRRRLLAT